MRREIEDLQHVAFGLSVAIGGAGGTGLFDQRIERGVIDRVGQAGGFEFAAAHRAQTGAAGAEGGAEFRAGC
jgi:hypothetical protein